MRSAGWLRMVVAGVVFVAMMAMAAGQLVPPPVFAGGDHDNEKLEHVVPLDGKSGISLLMARWYNENRLLYALVVTAAMALFGFLIGRATELVLKLIGLK